MRLAPAPGANPIHPSTRPCSVYPQSHSMVYNAHVSDHSNQNTVLPWLFSIVLLGLWRTLHVLPPYGNGPSQLRTPCSGLCQIELQIQTFTRTAHGCVRRPALAEQRLLSHAPQWPNHLTDPSFIGIVFWLRGRLFRV